MTTKELEIQGCKRFVCPNLSLIDEKGKELHLRYITIKTAKNLAVRYFKDTYHKPHYSSAKHLLPAFIYIASMLEGEKRTQNEVAEVFGTTVVTVKKWYRNIINTLDIKAMCNDGKFKSLEYSYRGEFVCPDLSLIDEKGKELNLKYDTIKRAKDLTVQYLKKTYQNPHCSTIESFYPALIYLASIINNDKRTQWEIAMIFSVTEGTVSRWYSDIIHTLGMKIIYGHDKHVIAVLDLEKRKNI